VASHLGIETVFQDLALGPHLTPAQNMYLGCELPAPGMLGEFGFMDNKPMRVRSKAAFDDLGATVRSYGDPVGTMSGGQRQASPSRELLSGPRASSSSTNPPPL